MTDATAVQDGTREILDYWLREVGAAGWWKRSDATDATITERFEPLWKAWRSRTAASFLGSAEEALAGVILFDQFSRNIFRGHADAFSTDALAIAIARGAIDKGYDDAVGADERIFFYLPFQHSEAIGDQQRSIALFTALGQDEPLAFARKHHDVIARFGRFPRRNAVLGRHDRPGEAEAATEGADW
ncbi:DUF924 family protein [Sphingomonas sanxanigenens]|uniref:DUF924 domain-containing protein n=1 Tax=Sphingomonas sanxanigenens DSM 19645 = NX02 TaxID=1123269 RepID=W0AKJ2_9SPHN|nr:DUF924 family protein [Sphingomonas sanxanigenens]AHE56200.1 hypothetical protein NX02_22910 [Sphingomonas sanxanigenens DSM 19645 = NX02]